MATGMDDTKRDGAAVEQPQKGPIEEERPPRIAPRLKLGPKVRDLFWCDFPKDAHLPEFWKTRAVIVIATDRTLTGAVTVIPCSSKRQSDNKWAHKMATFIDGVGPSYAICDKPCTVAVSRLSVDKGGAKRVTQEEFTAVMTKLHAWLPKLQPSS